MTVLVVLIIAVVIIAGVGIAIAAVSSNKEAITTTGEGSYFDGNTLQLIGYRVLSALVNTLSFGIAYPWMLCMVQRWEVKHTVIHGRRLKFNGHGHQLIGKYLLWVFLTIITFGIYGIWLGLGMKKWVVKHTVYADEKQPVDSYFSGGAGGFLGINVLAFFLTLFTFGIGKAWADKMVLKWEAKHTHIGGSPLEFNGTGGQLFVKYLLLAVLTPLTLGIYALFFTVVYMKWQVKHTEAVYQTPEIQAKARAHELTAVQDFAKYRIAANDQEIAAMKSGYTGNEDADTLERMAEENNQFAAYHLAKQLKGENALYEGRALELLQKAANGKYHPALLDLAKQLPTEQKIPMLTEAAQCGNAEASWLLATEYKKANNLQQSAYWFKVALEWDVADAKIRTDKYDELVKDIALQLSENRTMPQQSPVLAIVLGVAGVVLLILLVLGVMAIFGIRRDTTPANVVYITEEISIIQSIPADDIDGKRFTATASNGRKYEYVLNENLFYDREKDILYFEFGYVNGDFDLFLQKGDQWKTEPIPGSGIFKADYSNAGIGSTAQIAVSVDNGTTFGDTLRYHTVNVRLGTTAEAEEWLEQRYSSGNQTGESAMDNLPESIVGEWTWCEDWRAPVEVWHWTFNPDGTYEYYYGDRVLSNDGKYWSTTVCGRHGGTYQLNGTELTITPTLWDGEIFPEFTDTMYRIDRINGDTMVLVYLGDGRTVEFEKEQSSTDNTEPNTPAVPEVNTATRILGKWECVDAITNIYVGDTELHIWNYDFRSDGTFSYSHQECIEATNNSAIYYNGKYWMAAGGSGYDGQYTLNPSGEQLTVQYNTEGNGELITVYYTISINGDTLRIIDRQGTYLDYKKIS